MQRAFSTDLVNELGADEATFIGDLKLITAIQHQVIPVPKGERLIKRMSTLKRRPGVSAEKFQREWFDVHSELVKRLPEVKGYTQNLIFDRSHGRGRPVTYDELPIDGIVELWFRDAEESGCGFGSASGKTLMTHAEEFIAEISTFLVEDARNRLKLGAESAAPTGSRRMPVQDTYECDVLVIGSGASGMSAAVTAAAHDLKVLVIEKEAEIRRHNGPIGRLALDTWDVAREGVGDQRGAKSGQNLSSPRGGQQLRQRACRRVCRERTQGG